MLYVQCRCRPRPSQDGHALTYTVREIDDRAGEFKSQHHDRSAASYAFALATKTAAYAELRDQDGRLVADYRSNHGARWYEKGGAQ